MNKSRRVMRQQRNPFNHSSNKDGVIHGKFKDLPMFKICFSCTPYLLSGGELLFFNGDYDSWTVRIGNMKLEEGTKIETMMEEDYEYIQSEPDTKKPFQVARVGKWNLTGDGGYD
ncbi:19173_t:CDS:2, partial [Racocetra persica]